MKEDANDNERNIALYTKLVKEHGRDVKSLNWGSTYSQRCRFAVLTAIGIEDGDRILDVGCGLGDLLEWCRKQGKSIDYTGVDITPMMVEAASNRFPSAYFVCGDLKENNLLQGERYDYVVASGIFYFRRHEPFVFMQNMIREMFSRCRKGIAFNSLSNWLEKEEEGEYYADPCTVVDYCRTLTPYVTLFHDYHPGDFTIHMRKDKRKI